ncbi:YihY/virulence factor BrkB family protein [Virgibacillus oceani]|uniref:Ribonuclease-like protein YfkH n=1 Tax=Virgibacillus oceani TaxID=1479511 RepID=A0A917HCM3_9BACI|nr:YihY/virulence factor BrkB family protein [Virgibacillus oceani]GGG74803.1 putative ribonuclease-like protein YfkH [Virgibacillus oceani]
MENVASFFKELYKRFEEDDVFGLAAQLAYFFLLSLFPFLLFLVTLIGYLPVDQLAFEGFMDFIETYAPSDITKLINNNIPQLLNNQNGGLLSISIIGTLWSASNGIKAIMRAFNRAYDVDEDRSFVIARLIAIVLTIAMVLVISMAFLLPIFGKMIGEYFFSFFGLSDNFINLWGTFRWVISSVVFFIVLTALYKLAPNKRIYFKNAIWGALFATVLWQLVSLAFSFYVNTIGNYSAMYGSLGTVIILMIWFYISGIIIIAGGVMNAVIRKMRLENEDIP